MRIKDVFKVDVFQDAEIIAGKKGMDYKVSSISVLEVTGKKIETWVLENQLYITSFYAIIQNIEEQKVVIKTLHKNKAAGLVICHLDLFLKEIHPELIDLCNELDFPLIVANSNRSFIEILNPILLKLREKDTEDKYKNLINMQDKLIRYISTKGDLDYIYRTMTKEYGRKVFFLDVNHQITYPKYHQSEKLPLVIHKYFPEIIEQNHQKEFITLNEHELDIIIYPIQTSGLRYGSIVTTYEGDFNKTIDMLRSMASICTLIFTQTTRIREQDIIRKQEYITDLITWNFRNDEVAMTRGKEIGWNILKKTRLLLVNLNDLQLNSEPNVVNLEKFINDILYEGIKSIVKQNNEENLIGLRSDTFIILLHMEPECSYQSSKKVAENILQYCKESFKGSVSIGISSLILTHKAIPDAYAEAMDAAKIGRFFLGENRVTSFEDIGFYGILRDIQKLDKYQSIKENILHKFKESDPGNDLDLYKTLKALIYHDMNTQKAADALYLHKNSINYRKRKMVELLGYEPWSMPYLLNTILCIVTEYFDQ